MRHIAQQTRLILRMHLRTDHGPQAVGANQSRAFDDPRFGREHADPVPQVFEARHCDRLIQANVRELPAGIQENVVQVDAMNRDIGVVKPGPERLIKGNGGELLSRICIEHEQCARLVRLCANSVGDPHLHEGREHVGAHLDPVANGADVLALLKQAHRQSLPAERQGRRKAAKATAYNQDFVAIAAH
ncbi:hypothetical protein IVA93_21520 [Bradyrhizobium sp. 155]|uniref:hypothetical protein n=1 Tax=Bradyrhizobium sp. 155 TaxID=2782629 RepID=UPI001FFE8FC3|nr:hypothetical protein [Bradyrhizobium sp. 155]UPK15549.1 hypothetical protein IVA93_21520 [Bradyrhizobium sp. 155]